MDVNAQLLLGMLDEDRETCIMIACDHTGELLQVEV
jgi:hypothetical protein